MRDQRGFSDSIQWTILMPMVLLVIFGIIQVGLWAHGRTVAGNAAAAAAEEASLLHATSGAGAELGRRVAARGGLERLEVSVTVGATEVTATVSGRMPTFFDAGQTHVTQQVTRPRERVTTP